MKTIVIYPKNRLLKKYIKYFLFIQNSDSKYTKKHVCYPNTNHCLGLHKGNKLIKVSEDEYSIIKSSGYHSYLTGIYSRPITFFMSGVFDEICIDFEPFGIEMLTGVESSKFKFINSVIETLFSVKWNDLYEAAFRYSEPKLRATLLEQFFLNHFSEKSRYEFIPFNNIYENNVNELKNVFNLSYRSIHRLYTNKLGVSPKNFLSIVRFRKSINYFKTFKKQIEIAYENGYYDQSHFLREFKKYSGNTPKKFIKNSQIINDEVWWSIY